MTGVLVSASTGAMGSLLGKLTTMLTAEYKLLKEVRGDIKFLKEELEVMYAFLVEMSDVEEPDEPTKLRVKTVRKMSYDIEDNIDKFMVLVDQDCSSQAHGVKKIIGKCNKLVLDIQTRHKIAKEVKDIKNQLKVVSDRFARYKIDKSPSKPANERVDPRLCAIYKDVVELVGIDGPRDELVKWLDEKESESLKFASIVGYGGLGKTTLANQIHVKAGINFECQAFVSISQKPNMNNILRSILSQITKQDSVYHRFEDKQLIDSIRDFLEDKRYFIIIDDIWDASAWNILKCAFVKNECGSRVMITTRINDVAKSCCPCHEDLVYKIKPLTDADSKKLFFKRIFGCEENCPPSLKEASEDILKKCGGLPLAINAISSLLVNTGQTKEEWDRVRHSILSSKAKSDEIETMNYILSLSYFDLPFYLRSCLLYLTLFPEDYKIGRQRLVHRWISEGLIHGDKEQDLVQLGEEYFHELVNRSLIQPIDIGYDGKAKYCGVHDTILDFLIRKSIEEIFCTYLSSNSKPDGVVCRLSLFGVEDEGNTGQLDMSHARSLGAFDEIQLLPSLVKSKSLRVLDLESVRSLANHHIKDIRRLHQLRYLNIYYTKISELPRQIGDLQYLEILNMRNSQVNELPESATRLQRLSRLFVNQSCKMPDRFGKLVNLQELECIDAFKLKHVEELGKLINLRKLSIMWDTDGIEGNTLVELKEKLASSLSKLDSCSPRFLRIDFWSRKEDSYVGDIFFLALDSVREVNLYCGEIGWINRWLASLTNLEKVSTHYGKIEQKDVQMFGCMSNLLELKLRSPDSMARLIIGSEGFKRLQRFVLWDSRIGVLMFEPGAMPRLMDLEIDVNLFETDSADADFDFGIQHLSSLARIRVSLYVYGASAAAVEAAEGAFKSIAGAHPNTPDDKIQNAVGQGNYKRRRRRRVYHRRGRRPVLGCWVFLTELRGSLTAGREFGVRLPIASSCGAHDRSYDGPRRPRHLLVGRGGEDLAGVQVTTTSGLAVPGSAPPTPQRPCGSTATTCSAVPPAPARATTCS